MNNPCSGEMVWWRFKARIPCPWVFGYVTDEGSGLIRLGCRYGDSHGGSVVSPEEIEWREYRS